MTTTRRRSAAWVAALSLVLGLAACAQPEPTATPQPTPTPSPVETVAEPAVPTTRVPATCDEIFTSAAVAGGTAVTGDWPIATQAGNLSCTYDGQLGGYGASLAVTVFVDPPIDVVNQALGWTPAPSTGETSARCGDDAFSPCATQFSSGAYVVSIDVWQSTADVEVLTPSFASYVAELEALAASWPAPPPAWQPPDDVVQWSWDCGEVVERQNVVRDAVPFALGDARLAVIEQAASVIWVTAATNTTQCIWVEGSGTLFVEIVPGGAWMHEAGIPLDGAPYSLDGALAAALDTDEFGVQLSAYIDGSRVIVSVGPPDGSGIDGAAVARDVLTAIVAEFSGRR